MLNASHTPSCLHLATNNVIRFKKSGARSVLNANSDGLKIPPFPVLALSEIFAESVFDNL
jgi:hypothetical protein